MADLAYDTRQLRAALEAGDYTKARHYFDRCLYDAINLGVLLEALGSDANAIAIVGRRLEIEERGHAPHYNPLDPRTGSERPRWFPDG